MRNILATLRGVLAIGAPLAAVLLAASVAFAGPREDCLKRGGDTAIIACTALIRENDSDAELFYRRGEAYYFQDETDRGIADLTRAITIDAKHVDAYLLRGLAYQRKRQFDLAIVDYSVTIELAPNDVRGYLWRGEAYLEKGDTDRALADYDKSIEVFKIQPQLATSGDAYRGRGWVFSRKGDYARAIADYTKALEGLGYKEKGHTLNSRAWAYLKVGKPSLGLPDADAAVALHPNNPDFLETRGSLYAALGQRAEAIADFRRAISIDPDHHDSLESLKRLGASP